MCMGEPGGNRKYGINNKTVYSGVVDDDKHIKLQQSVYLKS